MFCQLGTTVFDGRKSFVSFSEDDEVVLVEHALISRKPRLQGAGLGLRTLSVSLFLHQEFCVVKDEVEKLRTSKDTFEVLPLLWGNGQLEGEFVIASSSKSNAQMDSLGNTIAVNITLTLKESVVDNKEDQQQQAAKKDAFAVGDKKPATKSQRVNPTSCNSFVSKHMSTIQSNAGQLDTNLKGYKAGNPANQKAITNCLNISSTVKEVVAKVPDPAFACIHNNTSVSSSGNEVSTAAQNLITHLNLYEANQFIANSAQITLDHNNLRAKIAGFKAAVGGNLKNSALRK